MKFIEAYKLIIQGTRIAKPDLNVNTQEGSHSIAYLSEITPSYVESGTIIRQDAPFIAAFDLKGGIHRLSESNAISMLLSEDDNWEVWVEKVEEKTEACSSCQETQSE